LRAQQPSAAAKSNFVVMTRKRSGQDPQLLAYRAAAAVAADDIVGAEGRALRFHADLLLILRQRNDRLAHQHPRVGHRFQALDRHLRQLVLLGLHHVRIGGFALQAAEVEFGDQAARRAVPELEGLRHQSLAKVFVDQAERGDDLERRRLRGRGARAVVDPILGLEQRDAMAEARARERCDGADRACTDDQDVSTAHGSRRLY
jgi:hypothetical protein